MFTCANDRLLSERIFQSWLSDLTPQERAEYERRVEQDRERDRALEDSWPTVEGLKVESGGRVVERG